MTTKYYKPTTTGCTGDDPLPTRSTTTDTKPHAMSKPTMMIVALVATLMAALPAAAQQGGGSEYDRVFLEAVMQRQKGNPDAAFDLLRHCIAIDPNAPEAHFYIAQYYMAMRDKDTAIREFEMATQLAPGNTTYLETLAQAYVNNKQYEEATATLEKLVAAAKGRDDVLEMLVQLYQQDSDYDNTIKTLDRLELLQGPSERLSYAKCEVYLLKGEKQAAVDEMRRLSEQYPYDLNYKGMYGDMLLMADQEEEALDVFADILAEEPTNTRAQVSMRSYYIQVGDSAAADSTTMRMLLNPKADDDTRHYLLRQEIGASEQAGGDSTKILALFDSIMAQPWATANMAIEKAAYMIYKKMPEADVKPVLLTALHKEPDNTTARLQLVSYAWRNKNWQEMATLSHEGRQYDPADMDFYYYEGIAHYQLGNDDEALDAFKGGIGVIDDSSDPAIVSDFYSVMGDILHSKGMEKEAFAAYDSCLQWKDDNIGCLNNYAYYLSLTGRQLDKAEQMSYRAIKAEPNNATYLDTHAWVLFKQGRYAEAKIYIDQAVQHDADSSAVILEHAGDIHAMNGNTDRAVELWQQAALKAPDNKLLLRKIRLRKYIKE